MPVEDELTKKFFFPGKDQKIYFSLNSIKEVSEVLNTISQKGDAGIRRFIILLAMHWNYDQQSLTSQQIQSLVDYHFPEIIKINYLDISKLKEHKLLIDGKYHNTYVLTPRGNWVAFIISQLLATLPHSDYWLAKKRFDLLFSWTEKGDNIGDFDSIQQLLKSIIESVNLRYEEESNETFGYSLENLRKDIIEQVDIRFTGSTDPKNFGRFNRLRQELTESFSSAWKRSATYMQKKSRLMKREIFPDDIKDFLRNTNDGPLLAIIECIPFVSTLSIPYYSEEELLDYFNLNKSSDENKKKDLKIIEFKIINPETISNVNDIPNEYRPNPEIQVNQSRLLDLIREKDSCTVLHCIQPKDWEESNEIIRLLKDLESLKKVLVKLDSKMDEINHNSIEKIRNGSIYIKEGNN